MNEDFVEIDGHLIVYDSIKGISRIQENYPIVFEFSPTAQYEFFVYFGEKYLHYKESFRVKMFSNNPKSQSDKDSAFEKITKKREEILKIINDARNNKTKTTN